jgi:glycosyltransferase involved in cell wall biosynthesis
LGKTIFDIDQSWIGGTELMALSLQDKLIPLAPEALDWNWIIAPGEINLRSDGKNIAWVHLGEFEGDISWLQDPLVAHIVFVSYYQYQRFIERYPNIDQAKCNVIYNAIEPIKVNLNKDTSKIKLIFHSEPYRGLDVLLQAMTLLESYKDIELHVFGDLNTKTVDWKIEFQDKIKDMCLKDSRVFLHGRVSNEEIRNFMDYCHMFAYPSTWRETSCISLIESMCAGLYCITNSFTVLPETGIGLTNIYPFVEDLNIQAEILAGEIQRGIHEISSGSFNPLIQSKKANEVYSWDKLINNWVDFIKKISV